MSDASQPQYEIDDGPDPKHRCDYCGTEYGLEAPPPLTAMCEHGLGGVDRDFAEVVRFKTLQDGRTFIQLDMLGGGQACILIGNHDAEALRVTLGRPGASRMVERYRS